MRGWEAEPDAVAEGAGQQGIAEAAPDAADDPGHEMSERGVRYHISGGENRDGGIGPDRSNEVTDRGVEIDEDRPNRIGQGRSARRVVAGVRGIGEVPEVVAGAMALLESEYEEVPRFGSEIVEAGGALSGDRLLRRRWRL